MIDKNNTSGFVGVSQCGNKWRSYIRVNDSLIHLGVFVDIKDAIKARKEAEEKYFGEFSYDNSRLRGDSVAVNQ